jgi:hypothetical protein
MHTRICLAGDRRLSEEAGAHDLERRLEQHQPLDKGGVVAACFRGLHIARRRLNSAFSVSPATHHISPIPRLNKIVEIDQDVGC